MSIRIHNSNRIEKLQQNLCQELISKPLADPFASEVIIVPTFAMSRWLNLRFARQRGIAANIEYPPPAAWLWEIAARVIEDVPPRDPLSAESMAWKIFSLLPLLAHGPEFEDLSEYLASDDSDIKRWQLSMRIAEVFERYQQYRPELIREWSGTRGSDWQAMLWQALIEDVGGEHRVAVIDRLIDRLKAPDPGVDLPQRISVFAVSNLAPLTLEVLSTLSRHVDVCFYLHNPSDQYIADLKSSRALSRISLSQPQEAKYYDTGNELLASWGSQAKSMQTLFLQQDYPVKQETGSYQHPGSDTLLQSIQQNIFDLGATPINTHADDSIAIHVCHSAMRECQVLYDQVLNILSANPHLDAEDILVMVPEISRYAPYIEAVFGYEDDSARPYLAWNLSDISIIDEHPLVQSFLQLLNLPNSRFEISEIMSLLEIPPIARRFDLDEVAVNDVLEWINATNVRWGIDDQFKLEINQPVTLENTWLQARQRLFAGYALGDIRLWNDIAPLGDIDTGPAVNIGNFLNLFERLDSWRKKLRSSATSIEWVRILNRLLEDFYQAPQTGEDYLQEIRDTIDGLNLAGDSVLSSALLRHWMQKQLSIQRRQGRLFSGGITFCGMRPMRNLPFEVICLLGMNDNAFPRRPVSYDFDHLNREQQPGDPNTANEDRYLMLETLLCARHTLYLSYTGRSQKDNSVCQPSVLVSEFIDFIDSQPGAESLSDKLIQLHPMQVFSASNFIDPLFSFDKSWIDVATSIQRYEEISQIASWPERVSNTSLDETGGVDLSSLHRFIAHPIKYYFNSLLKVYFEHGEVLDNDEPLSLDKLDAWQLKIHLADDILKGQSDSCKVLKACGMLPHGMAGSIEFEAIREEQKPQLDLLTSFSELAVKSISINIDLTEGVRLNGEISHYYDGRGLMHYSASSLNGKSILRLWIDHLCLCAESQIPGQHYSYLIAADKTVSFTRLESGEAKEILLDYCWLFQKGQTEILPIFPRSSYAYACEADKDKAMKKALAAWRDNGYGYGADEADEYIQLAMRNCSQTPLSHPDFPAYAAILYEQALKNMVEQ